MSTQWANALGSAAIVNLVTLTGVVLFGLPALRSNSARDKRATVTLASGFAAGALLSTAFFLMLAESFTLVGHTEEHAEHGHDEHGDEHHDDHRRFRLRMLGEEHHDEHAHEEDEHGHEVAWQWSIMILAGFCVVLLLDIILAVIASREKEGEGAPVSDPLATEEMATTGTKATKSQCASCFTDAAVDNVASLSSIRRVLFATIFGDAMHNFADGVFIATAFKVCSPAVGWAVVLGTVAHELAQELADFLVLTNLCNLKPAVALGINFASGITVLVGAIVVLAADLSERTVGMLLAFGAGLYIYTAAVECVPRLIGEAELRIKMTGVGFFALGAVAIGLVLLGHEHCD